MQHMEQAPLAQAQSAQVRTQQVGTSPAPMEQITVAEVRAAAELLDGVARYTPMESSRPLAQAVGGPVHLKCENLQRTGSFKIRGAYVRIARLSGQEKAAGVVAASAGNHAQGVALAASLVGSTAKVYMPVGASIAKLTATRAYGADVELVGESLDDALEAAHAYTGRTGGRLAGLAPGRPARPPPTDVHPRGRHRGGRAVRADVRARRGVGRRD